VLAKENSSEKGELLQLFNELTLGEKKIGEEAMILQIHCVGVGERKN